MRKSGDVGSALFLLVIAVIATSVSLAIFNYYETWSITVTVEKHWIDADTGAYVVATDQGLFEVDRPFWSWSPETNPDYIWQQLEDGEQYVFICYGWRFEPVLYMYPYVLSVVEVI